MTQPIEPLGLSANQWQFLSSPETYVKASTHAGRELVIESTRRQFRTARDILARLNGSYDEKARRGIMLADDVGLGKTTVAALVAWVVASARNSAGERLSVRILAPNNVMMRRWEEELLSHVEPLRKCAPKLDVRTNWVKAGRGRGARLSAGSIQVVKHSYAKDFTLDCDLLIIDEAHRAKGEYTAFSTALKRQKKLARRVLILTATPFSIHIEELQRMLTLVGGEAARGAVGTFSRALRDLYSGSTVRDAEKVANRLADKAKAAVAALSYFVIRHTIEDLKREQKSFGKREDWEIDVPDAKPEELELRMRMDRALRLARGNGSALSKATNDPRFDVGWRHFDAARESLTCEAPHLAEPVKTVVESHIKCIKRLRVTVGGHSKMHAVADVVESKIEAGEKVLLFCHHIATAQELAAHLDSVLPKIAASKSSGPKAWRSAWDALLDPAVAGRNEDFLRDTFIRWLCADLIRAQAWKWICDASASERDLVKALRETKARHARGRETIAGAAQNLFRALLQSKSSRAVLWESMAEDRLELLPGANGTSRVLGVCKRSGNEKEDLLFSHDREPDTVISIFNSPFGPDVLVVTDRLSEGIDLHRYCCHLVHYELDPSPIRTVQRNGRIRRVNSWAALTGQKIRYAYPAFRGTRDHRLVQIMKKRIDSFSLLLGGAQDFDVEEVVDSDEAWRNKVIAIAKSRLSTAGGELRSRDC